MTPAANSTLTFDLLGWPPDGPKLRLDYERFSYAGKFVMTNTGKAVVRDTQTIGESDGSHKAKTPEGVSNGSSEDGATADESGDAGEPGDVLAAAAFNADRTDDARLWIRYVTVARDRRGEGIGPELVAFVRDQALERGYDRIRIAVNNPFAYEALYRAGFAFTGETTGIAELVLEYEPELDERSVATYRGGLERFAERDLSDDETAFLERMGDRECPVWHE